MKKFIKSILLFIPLAIVIYLLLLFIWGGYIPQRYKFNLIDAKELGGHTFTRLQEMQNIKDIDILFLGSSHTYRGFDPRIFKKVNLSSFNLGSSSQTPIQTEVLVNRYLKQINPKMVIFEVFPDIFTSDGVESSVDIIGNSRNDKEAFKMAIRINNVMTYNTLLYNYMKNFLHPEISRTESLKTDYDTYISGGFVERKMEYFKHLSYQDNEWIYNQKQFVLFEKILEQIKNENIPIVLIYAPVTPFLYKSYTDQKEFDEKMSGYGDYYNFNEIIHLDDSLYFYDSHHMNQRGVEIFNEKLIEVVLIRNSAVF